MSEQVPTTGEIREYVEVGGEPRPWLPPTPVEDLARAAAFDRWLAAHDAEVLASRPAPSDDDRGASDTAPFFRDIRTLEPCPRRGALFCTITDPDHLHRAIRPDRQGPVSVSRERVAEHTPIRGGSSSSNTPGGYSGEWVICSCSGAKVSDWASDAPRIPIAEYPAHLLAALGITVAD